jgi:hypothetical protein
MTVLTSTVRERRKPMLICKYDARATCDISWQEPHLVWSPVRDRDFICCRRRDVGTKDQEAQSLCYNSFRKGSSHSFRLAFVDAECLFFAGGESNEAVNILQHVCQRRGINMHATTASPDCRQFWYCASPTIRYTRCGWRHCHWTSATSDA